MAVAGTVWAIVGVAALSGWRGLVTALVSYVALAWTSREITSNLRAVLIWTLPFLGPLVVIHGVLNPAYRVSHMFGPIGIRAEGLAYALHVSLVLALIACAAASWRGVRRAQVIALAQSLRCPDSFVVATASAISTLGIVQRRIQLISVAQQARGMRIGPGLHRRVLALVAISVPLVVTSLAEAHERGLVLASRGLGSHRLVSLETIDLTPHAMARLAGLFVGMFALLAFQ